MGAASGEGLSRPSERGPGTPPLGERAWDAALGERPGTPGPRREGLGPPLGERAWDAERAWGPPLGRETPPLEGLGPAPRAPSERAWGRRPSERGPGTPPGLRRGPGDAAPRREGLGRLPSERGPGTPPLGERAWDASPRREGLGRLPSERGPGTRPGEGLGRLPRRGPGTPPSERAWTPPLGERAWTPPSERGPGTPAESFFISVHGVAHSPSHEEKHALFVKVQSWLPREDEGGFTLRPGDPALRHALCGHRLPPCGPRAASVAGSRRQEQRSRPPPGGDGHGGSEHTGRPGGFCN
nr:collagen alpha-1(III) chain-like [Penaeus vannamei]